MDTHKMLMITVIALALVHALLSIIVFAKHETISANNLKMFLVVSIIVCLIIAGLAGYCMQLQM
jgi:predicted transglutaminase-like protease